jgi:hypothetical protein
MVLPPQLPHRRRLAVSGTCTLAGRASTMTSAWRPQVSHVALTARTPLARMLASVIGGPGLDRIVMRADC